MKSVLALLVLVALSTSDILKDGGLKGSWDDTFDITDSTFDNTAPGLDYDGSEDFFSYYVGPDYDDDPTNITGGYTGSVTTNYINFAITGESDRFYYSDNAGVDVTLVDGDLTVDMQYCTVSSDNSVSCYFYIYDHSGQHNYAPVITAWDEEGNWATYEGTALAAIFDDADRPYMWMIYDHTPDYMAPVIVTGTISGEDITLGTTDTYSNFEYVTLTVTVNDFSDETADVYDPNASGVKGVWAVLIDSDDIGTDNDPANEWSEALIYDTYDIDTEIETWGVQFAFANWAPEGSWNVRRFTAVDYAGNWATDKPLDTDITTTWSADNEDEVSSCQTLVINELGSDFSVTGGLGYAYISLTAGCIEKYTAGENYGWISFASPEYIMDGDTTKSSVMVGSYGAYGYDATYLQTGIDLDGSAYALYPGTSFGIDSFSTTLYLYDGQAGDDIGSWTLYEVITFTASGAVQRYSITEGAASSVVPSVIAVIAAALFALLRL